MADITSVHPLPWTVHNEGTRSSTVQDANGGALCSSYGPDRERIAAAIAAAPARIEKLQAVLKSITVIADRGGEAKDFVRNMNAIGDMAREALAEMDRPEIVEAAQ